MANTKISEMEEATSISENDILPIVKDGSNKKASIKTVFKTVQGFLVPDSIPIGMVVEFPSDNIPDNWLLCNGQAVSRTDYAELFAAIGTTWGAGDGSTTFNLPTKEGLVTVGKKTSDSDFNALGKTGGEKTHTLTVAEMAAHSHGENITSQYGYQYSLVGENGEGAQKTGYLPTLSGSEVSKKQLLTDNAGGGQPHNNLQPYTVSNFIIKAKQSSGVVATVVDNLNSTSATDALSAKQGKELNKKGSIIRINKTANEHQAITAQNKTLITFQNQVVNTNEEVFEFKNNGIYAKKEGAFLIKLQFQYSNQTDLYVYVYKNGEQVLFYSTSNQSAINYLALLQMEEGDYVQLYCYANTGGNINAYANWTFFEAVLL